MPSVLRAAPLSLLLLALVPLSLSSAGAPGQGAEAGAEEEPPLATPAPTVALEPAVLEGWESIECADCHVAVAREWASTAHAVAWVDQEYRDAVRNKRRPRSCYGCHAPEPLLVTGSLPERVTPRDTEAPDAHEGVRCVTCHAGPDGTILGPREVETDAHESVRSDQLLPGGKDSQGSNALCASCHATNIGPVIGIAKDFLDGDGAARGLSCVGCHMAPVERRWANAKGAAPETDESAPVRTGRSHALQTPRDPAFLRRAFGWSLEGEAGSRSLVVTNRAGHRVPGLIGRYITFEVKSLDKDEKELGSERLAFDTSAYLPAGGRREVALAAGATAVEVVGTHEDPRDGVQEFLRLRLPE